MLVDSVDIDIDLFVLVERDDVIVDGYEAEYEGKNHSQQADDQQLLPRQSDGFENTLKKLDFGEKENQSERVNSNLNKKGKKRN